jgi:mono/diheme cytochrome c family protein
VGVIVNGQKAMPSFAAYFSDEQIANVVNYIRTHFGNKYRDKVKPEDVKLMR